MDIEGYYYDRGKDLDEGYQLGLYISITRDRALLLLSKIGTQSFERFGGSGLEEGVDLELAELRYDTIDTAEEFRRLSAELREQMKNI